MGLNRTVTTALVTAAALSLAAACTGSSEEPSVEQTSWPYPESLIPLYEGDTESWCRVLGEVIPDNGYMPETEASAQGRHPMCYVEAFTDRGSWQVGADIYGQWDEEDPSSQEYLEAILAAEPTIPVEGFGSGAVLVNLGAVNNAVNGTAHSYGYGLALAVAEENLLLEFSASNFSLARVEDVAAPEYRVSPLPLTADTAIQVASGFMAELGAENHELLTPGGPADEGVTALPEMCTALNPGLELAADQSEWADDSEIMDRCHWNDGEADLWLSAEAVGPLASVGLSAQDFAVWWTSTLPAADGDKMAIGDEGFIIDRESDHSNLDTDQEMVTDFAVRIGNVVLQGRYQEGSESDRAAAEAIAATLADQVQSLLAGG